MEIDLHAAVKWADRHGLRWAFTLSNAGANYFEDRASLAHLGEIDWDAVQSNRWSGNGVSPSIKEGKQAEFLMEQSVPWELVSRIGVSSRPAYERASDTLQAVGDRPPVEIKPDWYY